MIFTLLGCRSRIFFKGVLIKRSLKVNYPGGFRYILPQIENVLKFQTSGMWFLRGEERVLIAESQLWPNPIIDPWIYLIYFNVSAAFSQVPYITSLLQLNCTSMQFRNVFCDCHLKFYCCLPIIAANLVLSHGSSSML